MKDRRPTLNRATQKSRLLIHKVLEPNTMESIGRSLAIYMEKLISVSGLNKGILMETTIGMQACDGRKIPVCTVWTLLQSPRLRKKRKGGKKDCCNSKSMTLLGEANQMRVWALGPRVS